LLPLSPAADKVHQPDAAFPTIAHQVSEFKTLKAGAFTAPALAK